MTIAYKVDLARCTFAFLIWFFGIRKLHKSAKWKKVILWLVFFVFVIGATLILGMKYYVTHIMGS